jgi:hypothetical protein
VPSGELTRLLRGQALVTSVLGALLIAGGLGQVLAD